MSSPLQRMTVGTACVIGVNVVAGAWEFSMVPSNQLLQYTMCPSLVLSGQWYRLVSSAYLHTGLLHLGVNMMSTAAVGPALEGRLGSVRFVSWIAWAAPLCSSCHVFLAYLMSLLGFPTFLRQHSLGFSGVLFALVVGETWRSSESRRALFGVVRVPPKLYPFAMLIAMQLLLPNISFLGHLAGLLVGALETRGVFACLPPSKRLAGRVFSSDARTVAGAFTFVPVPTSDSEYESSSSDGGLLGAARTACNFGCDVLAFLASFLGLSAALAALRARFSSSAVAYHRVRGTDVEQGGVRLGGVEPTPVVAATKSEQNNVVAPPAPPKPPARSDSTISDTIEV